MVDDDDVDVVVVLVDVLVFVVVVVVVRGITIKAINVAATHVVRRMRIERDKNRQVGVHRQQQ